MKELNEILQLINSYIGEADWFVYLLLGTGVFFTFYLKFPQIRYFGHALRIVSGKYDKASDEGDTSHFQALSTALSGTVGTGNIAGVALAIHLGGPAAILWMVITAFLGMTTKFVEVTLSHKYREKAEDGSIAGGPMYYMKNKLNLKWMAALFAIGTVVSSFGTGNLPQINSIADSVFATFGIEKMVTGLVLMVLLAFVILGGIKRIASITEKLVPGMALIYIIGALSVIIMNYENIIPSYIAIFDNFLSGTAATGGFLGASVAFAFNRGVNRGLFSNEAGQGSAPIAHAAARAHEPVSEGMVSILEPFIDTILICSLTALVILSSGVWKEKHQNQFQMADLEILAEKYEEEKPEHVALLSAYLNGKGEVLPYTGEMIVKEGEIQQDLTVLHARSVAEDLRVYKDEALFTGSLKVQAGKPIDLPDDIVFTGKSLVHSSPLTIEAFKKGLFGEWGQYIVSIGLLLFAFSTAISWSYYGGRAMTYLFGTKSIIYYNVIYVIAFFFGSFVDTSIIWTLAGVAIAMMTLPNLVGILLLRKDMKQTVDDYWTDFRQQFPSDK